MTPTGRPRSTLLAVVLLAAAASSAGRAKLKGLDEASDKCRACKRLGAI